MHHHDSLTILNYSEIRVLASKLLILFLSALELTMWTGLALNTHAEIHLPLPPKCFLLFCFLVPNSRLKACITLHAQEQIAFEVHLHHSTVLLSLAEQCHCMSVSWFLLSECPLRDV